MAHFRFTYKNGLSVVVPQSEVYNEVYGEVKDKLHWNGVPLAQEIEGWSELCGEGESFETDDFTVECI